MYMAARSDKVTSEDADGLLFRNCCGPEPHLPLFTDTPRENPNTKDEWRFTDPKNVAVLTTTQVLRLRQPPPRLEPPPLGRNSGRPRGRSRARYRPRGAQPGRPL